jgi:hypothetical protein
MGWLRLGSSSGATARMSGRDDAVTNGSNHAVNEARRSGADTSATRPGIAGPPRAEEIKHRQLDLLERYVAKVRTR